MNSAAASPRSMGDLAYRRVLCVDYDRRLVEERAAALKLAGLQVTVSNELPAAIEQARRSPFDAIVIGHLVPKPDRDEILSAVNRKSPRALVVLLYHGHIRDADRADAVLSVANGPKFLANSLRYLLLEGGSID